MVTSTLLFPRSSEAKAAAFMAFLAVDLGGSHISYGVVEDGALIECEDFYVDDSQRFAAILPRLTASLAKLANTCGKPIEGIGLGFCGIVDEAENRVASTNGKYVDAPDLDLSGWAGASLGLPLRLANDARLALRGEMESGAARGERNAVMITLGTGIGGVAAIDGKLPLGAHGFAAGLGGHTPVTLRGRRCTCGGLGCAESEASGWVLPILCQEQPDFATSALARTELNFRNLFQLAEDGDTVALRVRDHCLHVWGVTTVAAVHSFDPSVVVFGGGIMKSEVIILSSVRSYVENNAWLPRGAPRVVPAQLGNKAALFGVERLFHETR
jgi:glucokinase